MIKRINLSLSPEDSHDETKIRAAVIEHLQASERINMTSYRLVRKSVDARSRQPVFRMQVDVYITEQYTPPQPISINYQKVKHKK